MNLLKDILLQLFFLWLPLFVFIQVLHRRNSKPPEFLKQLSVCINCTASLWLCMQYPIVLGDGISFDMSTIPLVMSILYGGYVSGLLTLLVWFSCSFLLNDDSLLTYLTIPVLAFLPFLIKSRWRNYSKNKKYLLISLVFLIKLPLLYLLLFIDYLQGNVQELILDSFLLHTWSVFTLFLSAVFVVHLIEYYCDVDRMQTQIKRMRKLHHVSNLADEVSAEVQKPFTLIKGFTQLLGAESNKVNKQYVPIILAELVRVETMIDSYTNLIKIDTAAAKTISSKELLDNVLDSIKTYAKNNNVTLYESRVKNLRLRGNKNLLAESLISILKYCIDALEDTHGSLEIRNYLKNDDVLFQIIDVDSKLSKNSLQLLQDSPNLLNEKYPTLYAALSILYAHGGEIQIKQRLLGGIIVTVFLPAYLRKKNEFKQKFASS